MALWQTWNSSSSSKLPNDLQLGPSLQTVTNNKTANGASPPENGAINSLPNGETAVSSRNPIYNTVVRHGFAADYESEQYMSLLAEVGVVLL
jgi:hypothetical protein